MRNVNPRIRGACAIRRPSHAYRWFKWPAWLYRLGVCMNEECQPPHPMLIWDITSSSSPHPHMRHPHIIHILLNSGPHVRQMRGPPHLNLTSHILSPLTEEIRLKIFGSPDLDGFPVFSYEWQGLRLLTWNPVGNFGDSRENVFDMYGDSRENLLEILAVVIIWSQISSVRGAYCITHACVWYHVSSHIYLSIDFV